MFGEEAIDSIARLGNVEFAEYYEEKGLRMTLDAYYYAIQSGSLEMVKYLYRSGIPWYSEYTTDVTVHATRMGDLDILKIARENGCPWHHETSIHAAKSNDLEILQYLHRHGCPWHPDTFKEFLLLGEKNTVEALPTIEVFQFLHEKGCPWDKHFSRGIIQKVKDLSFLIYI